MNETEQCTSCGMPMKGPADHAPGIPTSEWCAYCSNEKGELKDFDELFERMVQWEVKKKGLDRATAEQNTRAYMKTKPAWKNHPKLD